MKKLNYFKSLLGISAASLMATAASAEFNTPALDGIGITTADYTQLAVQGQATGFGDDNQLDGLYMANDNTNLYIGIAGDLDGNAQYVFLNTDDRGTTEVATNPSNTYQEFEDLAAGTRGAMPAGFLADFVIQVKANGDTGIWDLGSNTASYVGVSAIDNSTTAGLVGASVEKGIELSLSLASLGVGPGDTVDSFAILGNNDRGFDTATYMSNQVLPTYVGGNLGADGSGGGGGDGISYDGSLVAGLNISPLSYTITSGPAEVREVWTLTNSSADDLGNTWLSGGAAAGRGIAFMPGDAAGNTYNVPYVIVPEGAEEPVTLNFMRAYDGEFVGSLSHQGGGGFLGAYRVETDDSGAIYVNGFNGAVAVSVDDIGTSMTEIIADADVTGASRGLDASGDLLGRTARVFVAGGPDVYVFSNDPADGSADTFDFVLVDTVLDPGGTGGDLESIAAADSNTLYVSDASISTDVIRLVDSGAGFTSATVVFTAANGTAISTQGIDVSGDLIAIGDVGNTDEVGIGSLSADALLGALEDDAATLDSDSNGLLDLSLGLGSASAVIDVALDPKTGIAYYQVFGGTDAVGAVQAVQTLNVPSDAATPSAALAALQSGSPDLAHLIEIDADTTDTTKVSSFNSPKGLIIDGNGNTVIVNPATGDSLDSALDPGEGAYIHLVSTEDVIFEVSNLTIAPADLGPGDVPGGDFGADAILVWAENFGDLHGFGLFMNNVTVAGNNAGTIVADPNSNLFSSVTRFDRGAQIPSQTSSSRIAVVRVSDFHTFYNDFRGFEINLDVADVHLGPGFVIAYPGDEGIAYFSPNEVDLVIAGTASNRNLIRGSGQIQAFEESMNISGTSTTDFQLLAYTDIIENGGETDFNESVPTLTDNCFFAYNGAGDPFGSSEANFRIGITNAAAKAISITNTTLHDFLDTVDDAPAGVAGLQFGFGGTDNITLTMDNVIISGPGDTGIIGNTGATNTINLDGVALPTTGANGLVAEFSAGDLTINSNIVNNDDPFYINDVYSYPTPADFLQVANGTYQGAGNGATDITGAGGPVIPGADVMDWSTLEY